jgi:cobalt-zinc-cadmium efflux system membrane fusion protein
VKLGRRDAQWAEVVEGITPGEQVVVEGGFTVKAELSRGELGGGHGH